MMAANTAGHGRSCNLQQPGRVDQPPQHHDHQPKEVQEPSAQTHTVTASAMKVKNEHYNGHRRAGRRKSFVVIADSEDEKSEDAEAGADKKFAAETSHPSMEKWLSGTYIQRRDAMEIPRNSHHRAQHIRDLFPHSADLIPAKVSPKFYRVVEMTLRMLEAERENPLHAVQAAARLRTDK